jgi:hypothetical protein
MERKALLVLLALQSATFTLTPNRATCRGEGRGWIGLHEQQVTLPDICTDEELTDGLRRAFGMCVPWKPKRQTS